MAKRYSLRKDGLYEATCRVDGKKKHFYGKTQAEAAAKRDRYLATRDDFPYIDEKITLSEWVEAWLASCRNEFSSTTFFDYSAIYKVYIAPSDVAASRLEQLTPLALRRLQEDLLARGLSPRTVGMVHQVLSGALKRAVSDGVIRHSPTEGVKRPRVEKRRAVKVFSREQIEKILAAAERPEYFRRFICLALYTGLRRGELLGLRWQDIDFNKMTLSVKQTVVLDQSGPHVGDTAKTRCSIRTISISPAAADVLRLQHAAVMRRKLAAPSSKRKAAEACTLVFPSNAFGPVSPNTVTVFFNEAVKKAGIYEKGLSLHALRHTHATFLLENGVNIKVIQDRLGHSSAVTTLDYYSHVSPKMDEEAARIADKITLEGGASK